MSDQYQISAGTFQILGSMSDPASLKQAILDLANKTNTAVNSIASGGGSGSTQVAARATVAGQTAAITTTQLYAVPANGAGLYRAAVDLLVTTGSAGATGTYNIVVNNNNGVVTGPNTFNTGMALTASGNEGAGVLVFYAAASTNITFSTTAINVVTGCVYTLFVRLEYLG
jgi:hypothetical protein